MTDKEREIARLLLELLDDINDGDYYEEIKQYTIRMKYVKKIAEIGGSQLE